MEFDLHSEQVIDDGLHGTIAQTYDNAAQRLAATGFFTNKGYKPFDETDLYKDVYQKDTKIVYKLTSVDPVIWTQMNATGSGGGIAIGDGTNLINNGTAILSNANGVSFGISGQTITASVIPGGSSYVFSNANNVTFGQAGNTVTASASFPTQTAFQLSNSNGISFGTNGSTVTASYTVPNVPAQTSLSFQNGNNVSFGINGSTLTASVPTQTSFQLSNSNGISFGTNGSTVTASYTVPSTAGLLSNIKVSAGTASNNLSAITLSNSNGISFGLNGSVITGSHNGITSQTAFQLSNSNGISFGTNGSTVTASYTVPTQSAQTIGGYAAGNTTGQSSSSTIDARSLSFRGAGGASVGYSNGSIVIDVNTAGGGALTAINVSGGTTSNNLSAFVLSNSNNVSFGLNGSTITGSASFSQSVQTQSNIAGIYDGANSISTGTVRLSNSNGITFGVNGQTITASHNGITSQTVQTQNVVVPSAGTQTATSGTVVFSNSNGITFGMSGSSRITASHNGLTNINFSAGTTSNNASNFVLSNSNNVSFGLNGSTITGSASFAQTNQSIGFYGLGNTTQNSSTTLDARTVSLNGLGALTVGYSNGSVQLSAPAATNLTGVGGISLSSNGSTVSISMQNHSNFDPYPNIQKAISFKGNGSLNLNPISIPNVQFRSAFVPVNFTGATDTVGSITVSQLFGLYTNNAGTLSLLTSASTTTAWTQSGTNTSAFHGAKYISMGLTATLTYGQYWAGIMHNTTTGGASASNYTFGQIQGSNQSIQIQGALGAGSSSTNQWVIGQGQFSASTAALPASINFSQIYGSNSIAYQPILFQLSS